MRKNLELTLKHACMQHAHPEEMTFVLIGRDAAAPHAIRSWAAERIRLGKNAETDEQIVEALACATTMETEGGKWAGDARSTSPLADGDLAVADMLSGR